MKTGEIKEMTEQRKSEGRREMNSVRDKRKKKGEKMRDSYKSRCK